MRPLKLVTKTSSVTVVPTFSHMLEVCLYNDDDIGFGSCFGWLLFFTLGHLTSRKKRHLIQHMHNQTMKVFLMTTDYSFALYLLMQNKILRYKCIFQGHSNQVT